MGFLAPRLSPPHLWGHHASLLLLQDTEKHSLTIVLPRLSRKSAATMGIWAAAL